LSLNHSRLTLKKSIYPIHHNQTQKKVTDLTATRHLSTIKAYSVASQTSPLRSGYGDVSPEGKNHPLINQKS